MILDDDIAIRHVLVGTRPRRAVVVPRRKVRTGRDHVWVSELVVVRETHLEL